MSDHDDHDENLDPREPISGATIAVGVVSILWALMQMCTGAFGSVGAVIMRSTVQASPELAKNPQMVPYTDDTVFYFTVVGTAMALPLGLMLLATGIGMLTRQTWSRMVGFGYGGLSLLIAVVGLFMNIFVVWPVMSDASKDLNQTEATGMMVGFWVGAGFGFGCSVLIIGGLLAFLSSGHFKKQLGIGAVETDEVFD